MSRHNINTKPIVIKVGGSFFSTLEQSHNPLLETIAKLHANKQTVVIVHGGGDQVLTRMQALGITSERKNGLRVTPDAHMPIITSVLAGELNKQLVAHCAKFNINAVGICLADGNIADCVEHSADIGAVGEPSPNSSDLLKALLDVNMIPIVASIGKDRKGRLYNVNADHAAICIARLLETKLFFFADVKGVLDKDKQVIKQISPALCEKLIQDHVITDGMVVKVKAAQYAANQIGQAVIIASWDDAESLLVDNNTSGTEILPIQ